MSYVTPDEKSNELWTAVDTYIADTLIPSGPNSSKRP